MQHITNIYEKGGSPLVPIIPKQSSDTFNLETIRLFNINYRHDFNGRPIAIYLNNNRLLFRTHPIYCSDGNHYGRIYSYQLIENKIINNDLEIYIYDEGDIIEANNINFLLDNIQEGNSLKCTKYFKWSKGNNSTEYYQHLYIIPYDIYTFSYKQQMNNGEISENELGFIRYKDKTYKIFKTVEEIDAVELNTFGQKYNEIDGLQDYISSQVVKEPFNGFIGYVQHKDDIIGYIYSAPGIETIISYCKQE